MTEHNEHKSFNGDEIPCQEISDPAVLSRNPVISVHMITYNHEPYIAQAIEGMLMQETDFPIELIIGEDCSTDRTREIILDYQKKHPQIIRVIMSEINIGAMPNLIRVAKACRGKYVAICEGDDYWTDPYKLQKQVDFLQANPDFSLCFHDALILWEGKSYPPRYFCSKDQKEISTIEDVIGEWFIPSASMVIRKKHITPLPEWFQDIYNGDYALHLLLAEKGKIKYCDEVMSVYRKQSGSLSCNPLITTDFVNKSIINLLQYFDKETNNKYHEIIIQRINSIIRKNRKYYLKKNHPYIYHLERPILTIGKIFRDMGLYIISKRIDNDFQ